MREPAQLAAIAARQHGVVTMRQANHCGLSRKAVAHRLETGWWQQLERGVYLTTNGEPSWRARAVAALLLVGRGAVLTLVGAAHLHGLEETTPGFVVVGVPPDRRVRSRELIRVRQRDLPRTAVVDGITVTSVEDTVLDLAETRALDGAVGLAARAVRLRRTTADRLARVLRCRDEHRWRDALLLALGDIRTGAESTLEVGFIAGVVRGHGLPEPFMQVPDAVAGGRVRRDFEWAEYQLIAEVDGELGHAGEGMRRDRARDRRSARTGRLTVRACWVDVMHMGCDLALDLALILRSRGWRDRPVACGPTCPLATDFPAT
jgi:hypothetical protein